MDEVEDDEAELEPSSVSLQASEALEEPEDSSVTLSNPLWGDLDLLDIMSQDSYPPVGTTFWAHLTLNSVSRWNADR